LIIIFSSLANKLFVSDKGGFPFRRKLTSVKAYTSKDIKGGEGEGEIEGDFFDETGTNRDKLYRFIPFIFNFL
jgi:hypothetical protein